ncbi:MAG TPA: ABC transporter ATP-binding protein, partial [Gaiellaceae bacterium]|nr:ABC transporter ATP-binding protein [Gaiellaceae bacterium]
FSVEPGESVGLVGRNGSGKTTLLKLLSGIMKPSEGRVAVGGRIGSLLELGAGFHPDFSGRENVFLNGSIHGLRRARIRERFDEIVAFAELEHAIDRPVRTYSSGMYMRLGFAIAAHLDADVLLLDEVFAVGDEAFQRKCFGKIFEFKQRGGTIVFVSHDATQVERLCERAVLLRAGRKEYDGPVQEALLRYRRVLAEESDPAERAAGLREWGSGEARIAEARLVGAEGSERQQFLAGEPLSLRVRVEADAGVTAPRLQLELRDDAGLLVAGDAVDTVGLGWGEGEGERLLRYDVARLPLGEGRFHLRLGLLEPSSGRLLHWLDDAVVFVVVPPGEERGVVLLEGSWALEQKSEVP